MKIDIETIKKIKIEANEVLFIELDRHEASENDARQLLEALRGSGMKRAVISFFPAKMKVLQEENVDMSLVVE